VVKLADVSERTRKTSNLNHLKRGTEWHFGSDGVMNWLFIVTLEILPYDYEGITIANEGLQSLGLCSALKTFE
jgi:hypothetical protein